MNAGTPLAPRRTIIPTGTLRMAGCALVLMLWLGLLTAVPPAAANPQQTPDDLRVELTEMSPAVLRPGDDLIIRGMVHNDSADPVAGASVELIMQRQALSSRTAVDHWQQGTTSSRIGTATPFTEDLQDELEPHSATPFTITMPSAPTFAATSPWGPRGIEVTIAGAGRTGSARSLLLWFPEESPLATPTELSVLLPLTPTSAEWHQAATDGLPVAATAATRLLPLLQNTQNQSISWALDPALLESGLLVPPAPLDLLEHPVLLDPGTGDEDDNAETLDPDDPASPEENGPTNPDPSDDDADDDGDPGSNGTDDDGNGDPGSNGTDDDGNGNQRNGTAGILDGPGNELLSHLIQDSARRDVLALGYADTDLAALAHARDLSLWRLGQQRGSALLERAGVSTLSDVHLPAGRVDAVTLDALTGEGVQRVITPESALTPDPAASLHGPTTYLDTGSGPVHAVVPDERISALLIGHAPDGTALDELTARQLLLADTAAAVREGEHSGTGLLATLPRDVTDADLDEQLAELTGAPWLDLTNLRGLLGRTPAGEARTATANLHDPARVDPDRLADLEEVHEDVTALASTLPEPPALLDQVEPALLATLSASWAGDTGARADLLDQVDALAGQITGAVRVERGSNVLLINHSGDLPVTVANDLPVPARVVVALQPQDPRLRAVEPVHAVLEPQTITTVRVPIQAVANGNVDLDVHVLSADGEEIIGQSASFLVRVRADWEDIGTALVAGLLAVGFVIGLVRTIRSGQRRFNPSAASGGSPATAGPGGSEPGGPVSGRDRSGTGGRH